MGFSLVKSISDINALVSGMDLPWGVPGFAAVVVIEQTLVMFVAIQGL